MHGIVWWKAAEVGHFTKQFLLSPKQIDQKTKPWTSLITWEDQRCSPEFLHAIESQLAENSTTCSTSTSTSSPLASGYGLATFAFMQATNPELLEPFDSCGTIQDLIAFVLTGKTKAEENAMDITNAFSWGGFDLQQQKWNANT
jgi:sedoheptulokinase